MKGWVVRCRREGLRETLARLGATGLREDWARRLRELERAGPTPRPRACSRCQDFLQGWKPTPNAGGITLAGILPDARIINPPRGCKIFRQPCGATPAGRRRCAGSGRAAPGAGTGLGPFGLQAPDAGTGPGACDVRAREYIRGE